MKTNDIKKGMKIISVQLGLPVTGHMMDNMRGDTRMIQTNGSEIGMFNELGSVYSHEITHVEVDGSWVEVEYTKKQLELKDAVSDWLDKQSVINRI